MSSSAGITLLRAVEHTRTEHQLRPGEGFAPDFTPVADRVTSMDAGRTMQLAKPPAWTERDIFCLNEWEKWDTVPGSKTPGYTSARQRQIANDLCHGCPSRVECLAAALEEEGDDRGYMRSGIRGGLTPSDRAALARQLQETGDVA